MSSAKKSRLAAEQQIGSAMDMACEPMRIGDLIRRNAQYVPYAPALIAVDGSFVSWQQLLSQADRISASLSSFGIRKDDCVALALQNGPCLGQAFLSVAACSTCAPINPAYSSDELNFYLRNLRARAIIVSDETPKSMIEVAACAGLRILAIRGDGPCGMFDLVGDSKASLERRAVGCVTPDSIALLLHTSGTTANPKLVPLSHGSLMASASATASCLQLSLHDRCLNVMPLFHIHGLVGGLLSALISGGSSICAPNFQPEKFFRWLMDTQATWYTAVPTMHRAVIDRAHEHSELLSRHPLRLVRSCSAPLSLALYDELLCNFNVPIVEAYGMTEAAHQIASNPLPPGVRKPGTVGLPVGPEVRVATEAGDFLQAGTIGEVVIRGATVMTGYRDGDANRDAFIDGWFRTGDLGIFDEDGYLKLVGRNKDQVNKGGMKISPLEVEDALLKQSEVLEAAAFGVPHPTLGETVGAAVVLRQGATTTTIELRKFLRGKIAQFKIPNRILLLENLPKGPTGKLQRRQLGELFQSKTSSLSSALEAEDRLEIEIASIWLKLLKLEQINYDDDFFDIGGDSLMAVQMLLEIERLTGQPAPETLLFDAPTIRQLARLLNSPTDLEGRCLIEVQSGSTEPPFIFFHGNIAGGYYTRRLCKLLDFKQRFIAVVPHGIDDLPMPASIEEMAAERLPKILDVQPRGPFRLGGYCSGGLVAFELARLLMLAGHKVEFVVMVDSPTFNARPIVRILRDGSGRVLRLFDAETLSTSGRAASAIDTAWRFASKIECLPRTPSDQRMERIFGSWRRRVLHRPASVSPSIEDALEKQYTQRLRRYVPTPLDVPIVYYSAEYSGHPLRHQTSDLTVIKVAGGHIGCITTELEVLASHMRSFLSP